MTMTWREAFDAGWIYNYKGGSGDYYKLGDNYHVDGDYSTLSGEIGNGDWLDNSVPYPVTDNLHWRQSDTTIVDPKDARIKELEAEVARLKEKCGKFLDSYNDEFYVDGRVLYYHEISSSKEPLGLMDGDDLHRFSAWLIEQLEYS